MTARKKTITIVAFGDSITRGLAGEGVTEAKTYRKVLQSRLRKDLGREVTVVNAGADSDITSLALHRMETDVLKHEADWITIMFGVNDAGFFRPWGAPAKFPRVVPEQFENNLIEIVGRVRGAKARPVLVTPVPMSHHYGLKDLPYYRERGLNSLVERYARIIQQVGKKLEVPVVDVFREFQKVADWNDLVPDGVHPSAGGQAVVAEILYGFFGDVL
ncbi:MAG: hypothetical protein JXQ73_13245 [Phycisphaerae bacterium]|nr:hypothetical protein [Phycisphaerae bacterium]